MGEMFSGGGMMGGGEDNMVRDKQATIRHQAKSDARNTDAAASNWLKLFSSSGGGATNPNFMSSLSGYYNGAPEQAIANKIALTGTFKPKVKPSFREVDPGIMGMISKFAPPGSPPMDMMGGNSNLF